MVPLVALKRKKKRTLARSTSGFLVNCMLSDLGNV